VTRFKFWVPHPYLRNAVKFCTQVNYIKSYQKNKSPQKGRGYGHVTYLNS